MTKSNEEIKVNSSCSKQELLTEKELHCIARNIKFSLDHHHRERKDVEDPCHSCHFWKDCTQGSMISTFRKLGKIAGVEISAWK